MTLDISKALDSVWHAGLLHKLKSYGISSQIFGLISSFLSNRQCFQWFWMKEYSSQEYPVQDGDPQDFIVGSTLFLLYIKYLLDVICNIAIYAYDTTLYYKCDQASDIWKQLDSLLNLNLIYETLRTGVRSGLLISMQEKLSWFCLTGLITMVLLT